jgi:hypothetical protein
MWRNHVQYRTVRVALLRASIQGFPIDWHQERDVRGVAPSLDVSAKLSDARRQTVLAGNVVKEASTFLGRL